MQLLNASERNSHLETNDETNLKSAIFIFTKKLVVIFCVRIYHSSDILRRLEQKPLSDILR